MTTSPAGHTRRDTALAAAFKPVSASSKEETVVIGLSGHGNLDLPSYGSFVQSYSG